MCYLLVIDHGLRKLDQESDGHVLRDDESAVKRNPILPDGPTVGQLDPGPLVIQLDGTTLTCAEITAAASRTVAVRLSESGLARAARSQSYAARTALRRPLYGRATGVGANRTVTITGDPDAHALLLLRSHATSAGPARPAERVRAMLVVRLNQLATGGSGVDPEILLALQRMIVADALPDVRTLGSIGTGDLPALATTALALMGEGPTSRPLAEPVRFGAADGLAFISSNAGVLGDAALAVSSLIESARAAVMIAALTFDAVGGNSEAYSDAVLRVTPFPGAASVGSNLRLILGADRWGIRRDGAGGVLAASRIQDPFGLRAIPQVHGPVLDALSSADSVIGALVNAPAENPLLLADDDEPDGGAVAHHAGFHYAYLQMALDSLALAVAQSGPSVHVPVGHADRTRLQPFGAVPRGRHAGGVRGDGVRVRGRVGSRSDPGGRGCPPGCRPSPSPAASRKMPASRRWPRSSA